MRPWQNASMTTSTTAETTPPFAWLPNALTWFRIGAGPFVAAGVLAADRVVFSLGAPTAALFAAGALVLFLAAALTDLLDGWLARRLRATTPLGAALDHAADKALTTAAGLALAAAWLPFDLLCALLVILTRDAVIGGLREGLAGGGRAFAVSALGKVKTVAVLVGLAAALALHAAAYAALDAPVQIALLTLARAGLWAGAAFALLSGFSYTRRTLSG